MERARTRRLLRFLTYVGLLDLFALALAARFTPPDPLTAVATVGPMLVVAPVMVYWAVYVRGRDRPSGWRERESGAADPDGADGGDDTAPDRGR